MVCLCKHDLGPATAGASAQLSAAATFAAGLPPPPIPAAMLALGGGPKTPTPNLLNEILDELESMLPTPVPLTASLPQLSSMVAAAQLSAKLDMPLPGSAPHLAAMISGLNPAALAPLMAPSPAGMANLSAHAAAALQMKAQLGAFPWEGDLAPKLSETLGGAGMPGLPGGAPPAPPAIPPETLPKLPAIPKLGALASLAASLGVNLAAPGGLASFAAALAPLAGISLPPPPAISPALAMRLSQMAQINAAFGAGAPLSSIQPKLQAMLSLKPPALPGGMPAAPPPSKLPPLAMVKLVKGLDLNALAAAKWSVPAMPPLASALPTLSAVASLNAAAPVLRASPCGAGCPMAAIGA